jgi:hypothetical protein
VQSAVALALGLSVIACIAALTALLRQRRVARGATTLQLSLALLRADTGLAQLDACTRRSDTWWTDVADADRREIDRALTRWDLAAWYVARDRADSRVVFDVLGWEVIELWERAYPYVLHRRVEHPTIWSSLTDLYLDAYATTRSERPAVISEPAPIAPPKQHSVSPDVLPPPPEFIEVGPPDHLRPTLAPPEPAHPRPAVREAATTTPPRDVTERLVALLREGEMNTPAAPLMPPVPPRRDHVAARPAIDVEHRPAPSRRTAPVAAAFVQVLDLTDSAVSGSLVDPVS